MGTNIRGSHFQHLLVALPTDEPTISFPPIGGTVGPGAGRGPRAWDDDEDIDAHVTALRESAPADEGEELRTILVVTLPDRRPAAARRQPFSDHEVAQLQIAFDRAVAGGKAKLYRCRERDLDRTVALLARTRL